jgi:hypothetical protein
LFRWLWSDPADDCLDDLLELTEDDPPPLRERVRRRTEPATATLWGVAVTVANPRLKGGAR